MDQVTAATDHTLLGRFCDWIKARALRDNELTALTRADLGLMATDLGITEADLRDILPRTEDHSHLMDRMMEARGLDPVKVRGSCSALVRDMELTCSRCQSTARCQHDLALGTAAMHAHDYCANSQTFTDLTVPA